MEDALQEVQHVLKGDRAPRTIISINREGALIHEFAQDLAYCFAECCHRVLRTHDHSCRDKQLLTRS